jgi:hypothetical protein
VEIARKYFQGADLCAAFCTALWAKKLLQFIFQLIQRLDHLQAPGICYLDYEMPVPFGYAQLRMTGAPGTDDAATSDEERCSEQRQLLGFLLRIRVVAARLAPHYPGDRRSSADACRECGRNCLKRMLLYSLSCVVKNLRGSLAALFCDTPHRSAAIFKCIRNGGGRSRSLASRFVNLYAHLFQH